MTLSLDTNVLIEIIRNRNPIVRSNHLNAQSRQTHLVVSLIVLHELEVGCERNRDPEGERARVRFALARSEIAFFDEPDMIAVARLSVDLSRRGLAIGAYDLLIAGQALARRWTVVTANRREFDRIEGLNVVDWTMPAD